MKRTIIGLIVAMVCYIIGCRASYNLGYDKGYYDAEDDFYEV